MEDLTVNNVFEGISEISETATMDVDIRKNDYGNVSFEDYMKIKEYLLELGAKESYHQSIGTNTFTHKFILNGVRYSIWYTKEKTKEEKCAELKKQLADLGCHY